MMKCFFFFFFFLIILLSGVLCNYMRDDMLWNGYKVFLA
jgi:hypothetical protein